MSNQLIERAKEALEELDDMTPLAGLAADNLRNMSPERTSSP